MYIKFRDTSRTDLEIIREYAKAGAKVQYIKPGARYGLIGVLEYAGTPYMVVVRWLRDASGKLITDVYTTYKSEALTTTRNSKHHNPGYLLLLDAEEVSSPDPEPAEQWVIAGREGGTPRRFTGSEPEAMEVLENLAKNSKSGQQYVLYKAVAGAQKTAPVEITKFE